MSDLDDARQTTPGNLAKPAAQLLDQPDGALLPGRSKPMAA